MRPLVVQLAAPLLGMLLLAPGSLGHDDISEDEREVEVEEESDGFELRSDREEDDEHDRIRLRLDGDNVRFEFEFSEGPHDLEVESELGAELERVLEFKDVNGDGAFQESDEVQEEYDDDDFVLTNISTTNVSSGGVDGIQVTTTYAFVDHPGSTMGFRVTAFGNLTTYQGLTQTPVEMKMDILFTAFPYTEDDTLPAIEFKVEAESPEEPNITANQVSIQSGNFTAVFAWESTATVDGVEEPVGITVLERETEIEEGEIEVEADVVFAYARGDDIVHDPTFAFIPAPITQALAGVLGNPAFYALGVLAAAGVIGSLALIRRRQRVKED
jgi:hypothetical protein